MKNSPFPAILLTANSLQAQGSFAAVQAKYFNPDWQSAQELTELLRNNHAGIVAHFYMDPELQGMLYACSWPHIHISDSLVMADRALEMAKAGLRRIFVLGVDFMSENVRTTLDASEYSDVEVYRLSEQKIGCSLAKAADSATYATFLQKAAASSHPLHVIYINTSLYTKAYAQHLLPTLTCTSGNVVQTILQAFAQEPSINLWFGPDTYMGENLKIMFEQFAHMEDAHIAQLHPHHHRASIQQILQHFHYFQQGNCIVHHMFGADVAEQVERDYPNAYITAHLEVPGEMFALALAAQKRGRGVVGSTANILHFIHQKVLSAASGDVREPLSFILGTETGMVTAIVHDLRKLLAQLEKPELKVEIIFPVATEAAMRTTDTLLPVVPGSAGSEGCSTSGGCATCPYMKMNSLDSLMDLLHMTARGQRPSAYFPKTYHGHLDGQEIATLGQKPILDMREFQRTGQLPSTLLQRIRSKLQVRNGLHTT